MNQAYLLLLYVTSDLFLLVSMVRSLKCCQQRRSALMVSNEVSTRVDLYSSCLRFCKWAGIAPPMFHFAMGWNWSAHVSFHNGLELIRPCFMFQMDFPFSQFGCPDCVPAEDPRVIPLTSPVSPGIRRAWLTSDWHFLLLPGANRRGEPGAPNACESSTRPAATLLRILHRLRLRPRLCLPPRMRFTAPSRAVDTRRPSTNQTLCLQPAHHRPPSSAPSTGCKSGRKGF